MKESKKRLISLIGTTSVVAVVAIGFTYSWLSGLRYGSVSNINISVVAANELAISFADSGNPNIFYHRLTEGTETHTFAQISGDGANFFSYVATLDSNNSYYVSGYRQIPEESYNDFLLYKVVNFRVNAPISLYLDCTSYLLPANVNDRRLYGFSKDYIAGAMRVGLAAVKENNIVSPLFVWAPNSQYHIQENPISFNETGDVEDDYTIVRGTTNRDSVNVHTNRETFGSVAVSEGEYSLTKFVWGNPTENEYLLDLEVGITKLVFTVWLEGTDRECNSYLAGGHINADIKFTC